ncbi:MAG: class I SAM-dependent methyltransferase, partial [Bacteriovoracaceae bacterium]
EVSDDPASYKNLDPRALCTSVEDVLSIIENPLVKGTWVDLGSGLGHTVLTYAHHSPDRAAIGIEKEEARVRVARKLAAENHLVCEFICGDLLTDPLPEGDVYFLYFPQGHVLDRVLSELAKKEKFVLIAIESHGDLFPRLDQEKWLTVGDVVELKDPRHNTHARIYLPQKGERKLPRLHEVSFLERFFLVKDDSGDWIGESFGLFSSGDEIALTTPPRTVKEENVVKIMTSDELHPVLQFLVSLRRLPDVKVSSGNRIYHGPIRKILVGGAFSVEFPGGERVEWKDINRITQGTHLCYDSFSGSSFSLPVHS